MDTNVDQETPDTYWDNRGKDKPTTKPDDVSTTPSDNIDVDATAARDRIQQMVNRGIDTDVSSTGTAALPSYKPSRQGGYADSATNESLDRLKLLAGLKK